jgi:hypothetical protein
LLIIAAPLEVAMNEDVSKASPIDFLHGVISGDDYTRAEMTPWLLIIAKVIKNAR